MNRILKIDASIASEQGNAFQLSNFLVDNLLQQGETTEVTHRNLITHPLPGRGQRIRVHCIDTWAGTCASDDHRFKKSEPIDEVRLFACEVGEPAWQEALPENEWPKDASRKQAGYA